MFEFAKILTPQLCRASADKIFVFGDNLVSKGKAGQAIIRDEPNAFGVPTKRLPSMSNDSFFSDQDEEYSLVRERLIELWILSAKGRQIVLPEREIGSGLAQLETRSPRIWAMIQDFYQAARQKPSIKKAVETIKSRQTSSFKLHQ